MIVSHVNYKDIRPEGLGQYFAKDGRVHPNTPKDIKDSIFKFRLGIISSNILIEDVFTNNTTKVSCKCGICKHTWLAIPRNLLIGRNCPACGNKARKVQPHKRTPEDFDRLIHSKHRDIRLITPYTNNATKVQVLCTVCKHVWDVIPTSILNQGTGCPKCSHQAPKVLYLMYLPIDSSYKIGVTKDKSTLVKRSKQVHKSMEVVYSWEFPRGDALVYERLLHKQFNEQRFTSQLVLEGSTEFFQLNKLQIEQIYNIVQEYINDSI